MNSSKSDTLTTSVALALMVMMVQQIARKLVAG